MFFRMIVTLLGSGTSQGVPFIGCQCPTCTSSDPRDKRKRCSAWIRHGDLSLLIDTTPDFHSQAIRADIRRLDAVLITHGHADHVMGFDDLRRFCEMTERKLPVYASPETMARLRHVFGYAFDETQNVPSYLHVEPHEFSANFTLGDLEIEPVEVPHGTMRTHGFLFKQGGRKLFGYFSDIGQATESFIEAVHGVEVLVIDGLRDQKHPTHLGITEAVDASRRIQAKQTYLTHLAHHKTHVERLTQVPPGVSIAYDGLTFELPLPA